ncbi:hypothetical protein ABK040_008116 [Willaertia magna]
MVQLKKINPKYESNTSRASIHYIGDNYHLNVFPFTLEELLNHVEQSVESINNNYNNSLKNNTELGDQVKAEKINFSREKVRAIYLYGSRTFQTNVNDSDFDFFIVCDDLTSENSNQGGFINNLQYALHTTIVENNSTNEIERREYELELMIVNTLYFLTFSYSQLPLMLLTVQQPNNNFILFEDEKFKFWRNYWNIYFCQLPRSKNSFLHELSFSYNKAFRFWKKLQQDNDILVQIYNNENNNLEEKLIANEMTSDALEELIIKNNLLEKANNLNFTTISERKSSYKKVKKNLAHGIRFLKYGYQICFAGYIYDYLETNTLYDKLVYNSDLFTNWKEYDDICKPLYNYWTEEFKSDIKKVLKSGRERFLQLNNETEIKQERKEKLFIIEFLNKYCENQNKYWKDGTFAKEEDQLLFKHGDNNSSDNSNTMTNEEEILKFHYSFGPFTLSRIFAINVTPMFCMEKEKRNDPIREGINCFKFDFDPVFQELENNLNYIEANKLYVECNGLIIEQQLIKENNEEVTIYKSICVPRFHLSEWNNLIENSKEITKHIDFNLNNVNLQDYIIHLKPNGVSCNLYFHNREWKVSNEKEKESWWKDWILNKNEVKQPYKDKEVTSTFWKIFKEQGMNLPTNDLINSSNDYENYTFYFILQKEHNKIIYCGCRNLITMKEEFNNWKEIGLQFNWKEQVIELKNNLSINSYFSLINNYQLYSPKLYQSLQFLNRKNEYKSFEIKSTLFKNIPSLRITNLNYPQELLDLEIIRDPPVGLVSSKYNDEKFVEIILCSIFSNVDNSNSYNNLELSDDEELVKEMNPLFFNRYLYFKKNYIKFCKLVNEYYKLNLLKEELDNKEFKIISNQFLNGAISKIDGLMNKFKKFINDKRQLKQQQQLLKKEEQFLKEEEKQKVEDNYIDVSEMWREMGIQFLISSDKNKSAFEMKTLQHFIDKIATINP